MASSFSFRIGLTRRQESMLTSHLQEVSVWAGGICCVEAASIGDGGSHPPGGRSPQPRLIADNAMSRRWFNSRARRNTKKFERELDLERACPAVQMPNRPRS